MISELQAETEEYPDESEPEIQTVEPETQTQETRAPRDEKRRTSDAPPDSERKSRPARPTRRRRSSSTRQAPIARSNNNRRSTSGRAASETTESNRTRSPRGNSRNRSSNRSSSRGSARSRGTSNANDQHRSASTHVNADDAPARVDKRPARSEERSPKTIENREELEQLTGEVLSYLVAAMDVNVDAFVLNDLRDGSVVFEIEGEDAGLLIGRRGETLRDLQLIARLLVSRQLMKRANIIVDVEQYQLRRVNRLQSIAENAAKAASKGDIHSLEPMSPDDRRIIHMTLSDNPRVVTESQGQGEGRHVVVKPN